MDVLDMPDKRLLHLIRLLKIKQKMTFLFTSTFYIYFHILTTYPAYFSSQFLNFLYNSLAFFLTNQIYFCIFFICICIFII